MSINNITRNILILILVLTIPMALSAQTDSRYDSGLNLPFNQKAGDVNPQTGNLTLSSGDVALPGRAGLNFTFSRIWSLNQANVFQMNRNSSDGLNYLSSDTIEQYNHMGVGWSSNLPYVFTQENAPSEVKNLFFNGSVFELDTASMPTYSSNESNLRGYDLLDLRMFTGTAGSAISYADFPGGTIPSGYGIDDLVTDYSEYVLILKDNSKYYFRPDGKIMMQQDKTGLNRIWYFYDEYQTDETRLVLVVDTIGRHIVFSYNTDNNLSSIAWSVNLGTIDASDDRAYSTVQRSVSYTYIDAEQGFPAIDTLADSVVNKRTPYALQAVTDVQGNVTRYEYEAGNAYYSFNSAVSSSLNIYLMLNEIISMYTIDGYKNKRCFEYDLSEVDKTFYLGFMEYYRISRQYNKDRHGRIIGDTAYSYNPPGDNCGYNEYQAIIKAGNITTIYTYTLSELPNRNNVLDAVTTSTTDGFLQYTDYVYTNDRAIDLEDVHRNGTWVYSEDYDYDKKGNLVKQVNRRGLDVMNKYDEVFSIPTETTKTLWADGVKATYKTTNTINTLGQVTEQFIYLDDDPVRLALTAYDSYGNVISQTDADGNVVHTEYDDAYTAFPVKTWQEVTIAAWTAGGIAENWKTPPDTTETELIRTWKVFNTDGTVWMEVDNEGFTVEHYYDAYGQEIRTINPDQDDVRSFAADFNYSDLYAEYFQANMAVYFASRELNPGAKVVIDYQDDLVKSYADIDKASSAVKITGAQGDGLGNPEEEIEYDDDELPYAVKTMTYDTLGRMVGLTDPDAGTSYTELTVNGTTVKRYDKTWIVKYDDLGRQILVLYPETTPGHADMKTITYNDLSNTVTTKDPEGRTVIETKDWNGNLVKLEHRGDSGTPASDYQIYTYGYDLLDRKVLFTDPKGIITKYSYDERNLLVKQYFGATGSDIMEYNDLGRLVKKTDRSSRVSIFVYDELGRNTKLTHYTTYIADGNPGNVEEYSVNTVYDFRGNAVRIDNQNLIEYYVYDFANRVATLSRRIKDTAINTLITDRVWDGLPADLVFTFTYEYNDAGMVTAMTYPDGGEHNFAYDPVLGRLENIKDGLDNFISDLTYSKSGIVTRMDYANSAWQTWTFDNRKRISHISIEKTAGEIAGLTYAINGSGDILSINDNEYKYDGFDRIVYAKTLIPGQIDLMSLVRSSFGTASGADPIEVEGETRTYNAQADINTDGVIDGIDHAEASFIGEDDVFDIESFSYDKNGNRTTLIQNGDIYRSTFGDRNRLLTIHRKKKGETTEKLYIAYEYDNCGNTTKRTIYKDEGTEIITFNYDTMNRLVKTTRGTAITEYFYDNAGNRFIKKSPDRTTVYLRHGQIAVAMDIELPAATTEELGRVNRYVLSGDLLAGRITVITKPDLSTEEETSYYHLDHLNSTKCVTDETGVLVVMYEYRAFGEQLKRLDADGDDTDDAAKYSYGGKELDDGTNLYYFNARYYDATIGRFINVDPMQDGTNWYVYCKNNPLNSIDPTGLDQIVTTKYFSFDKKQTERLGYEIMKAYAIMNNPDLNANLAKFANTEYIKQVISTFAGKMVNISAKAFMEIAQTAEKEKMFDILNSGMQLLYSKDNTMKDNYQLVVEYIKTEYNSKGKIDTYYDDKTNYDYELSFKIYNEKGKQIGNEIKLSNWKGIIELVEEYGKQKGEVKIENGYDNIYDRTKAWIEDHFANKDEDK